MLCLLHQLCFIYVVDKQYLYRKPSTFYHMDFIDIVYLYQIHLAKWDRILASGTVIYKRETNRSASLERVKRATHSNR